MHATSAESVLITHSMSCSSVLLAAVSKYGFDSTMLVTEKFEGVGDANNSLVEIRMLSQICDLNRFLSLESPSMYSSFETALNSSTAAIGRLTLVPMKKIPR